jgi:hypothetical protein
MSNDDCPWGHSSVWDDALRDAETGDLALLVDLLRTTTPITQSDRNSLARLLERGKFRPEPQPKDTDFALYEAACQVQALCASQKLHRKLAGSSKESIFNDDGKLNPLLQSCDDPLVLTASPYIKKNLHKMSRDQLIEQIANERGVAEEALHEFLGCRGRNYRRLLGRK